MMKKLKPKIRIAISGKSGCGNSTISKLTAARLGLKMINYTFHSIAEERQMDFKTFYKLADADGSWDLYLDKRQVELAEDGDCVLGSRLAVWMLKNADLKVFLDEIVKPLCVARALDVERWDELPRRPVPSYQVLAERIGYGDGKSVQDQLRLYFELKRMK